MVLDMVRSIVREEVTILQKEVRLELQSFYERISTLIESSFADPVLGLSSPSPPASPPPPQAGKEVDPAFGPPS